MKNRKIQQQQIFAQRHCYRCTYMYDLSIKFTFSNEGHGQNYISSEKCRSNKNKNGGYLTALTLYLVDNGGYRDRS